ncbi:MAG: GntR family transcriptional regulator [Mycoplasmoidaceae bacterium]
MKSSKSYIIEYIILKILNGDFEPEKLVWSENKLAIKFNCTRLTSRSALINLVNLGILEAFKGLGYVVSENALDILFFSKSLKDKSISSKYKKIEKIHIISDAIQLDPKKYEIYSMHNYGPQKKLDSISFILINKNAFAKYYKYKYKMGKIDPVEGLIKIGFIPYSTINNFWSVQLTNHENDLKKLGYLHNNQIPLVEQTLINDQGKAAVITFSLSKANDNLYSSKSRILSLIN